MLVLLFGVSGVGKPTLIRWLVQNAKWQPLLVYTTRPPRLNDLGRKSVTPMELDTIAAEEGPGIDHSLFGFRYVATDRKLKAAKAAPDVHVLDVAPRFWSENTFDDAHSLLLMPEDREQLVEQVRVSRTLDRLESSLIEYDLLKNGLANRMRDAGVYEITNCRNGISGAGIQAVAWADRLNSSRNSENY